MRKGDWIQTYSGGRIYPIDPNEDEIQIEDIAHALSLQCRYTGHCKDFYSVAEHCILLSHWVDPEYAFDALMHDASEAYLADIARPTKPYLNNYYEIEDNLMKIIANKYNFSWPPPKQVKEYDTRILNDERSQNMNECDYEWNNYGKPLGIYLSFFTPKQAEKAFLKRFKELVNNKTPNFGV